MKLTLNVYDKKGKDVVKTVEGETYDIMFSTVRSILGILNIEKMDDTMDMLMTVSDAWNELTAILDNVFPDMGPEDWEGVKIKELLPVLVDIFKFTFGEILGIPTQSKN